MERAGEDKRKIRIKWIQNRNSVVKERIFRKQEDCNEIGK